MVRAAAIGFAFKDSQDFFGARFLVTLIFFLLAKQFHLGGSRDSRSRLHSGGAANQHHYEEPGSDFGDDFHAIDRQKLIMQRIATGFRYAAT